MALPDDDDQEKPLDPAVEKVRRRLVRFIAINLGILFIALMAVVIALVYRATQVTTPPAPPSDLQVPAGSSAYGEIVLPQNARVTGHSLAGNRISLAVEFADGGSAIFVYDMAEGRMVGRFDIRDER